MEKIKELLQINWVHQLIGALCFMAGAILGALVICILWKKFAAKQKTKEKVVKDIEYIAQNAISVYQNGKSKLEIEKISYLCEAITYLLDKIPQEYGNSKVYDVLKKQDLKITDKEILLSDLGVRLDFTVYELLGFINCLASELRGEVYSLLESKLGKLAWGVGKIAFKNTLGEENNAKNLDEITVKALQSVIAKLTNKPKKEDNAQGFFAPILDKAKGVAFGVANTYLDVYVKEIIEIFANELNKLYSGQFKKTPVKDLSDSVIGEGV